MNEPWEPPVYREIHVRPSYTDYACSRCGSFVENIIEHNRHHHNLDKLLNAVLALQKILLPTIPPGVLLEELPAEMLELIEAAARGAIGDGTGEPT